MIIKYLEKIHELQQQDKEIRIKGLQEIHKHIAARAGQEQFRRENKNLDLKIEEIKARIPLGEKGSS